jgi:histidine triad (HIT) family protein
MADCLFCKILDKQIPAKVVYEDDELIAIQDIHPQAPVHLLLLPKRHIERVADVRESDIAILGKMILQAKRLAESQKVDEGFRLVFNSGPQAGQSVFHIHLHLLGGRRMSWPPG